MRSSSVLAALLLLGAACAPDAPRTAGRPRLVLLVSIDNLRADHLGAYGYERPTSPVIDALADEGVLFEHALSTAPWTLPAHASLLTGLYPGRHGAATPSRALAPQSATLASLLAERGYTTAAVVNVSWLRPRFGLTSGFDRFEAVRPVKSQSAPSRRITDRAMDWLREYEDEPLFLFLHYYDVHADYASLPRWEELFVSPDYAGEVTGETDQLLLSRLDPEFLEGCRNDPEGRGCGSVARLPLDGSIPRIDGGGGDDRRHLIDLYDASIRQLDAELKRLIDFLRGYDWLDDTLLVLTADHGEEFFEHGSLGHSHTQYQELLHVPLLMRGAGLPAGVRVSTPVSLVDVVPTVLAMVGAPAPPDLDGVDLSSLWSPGASGVEAARYEQRMLFAEASHTVVADDLVRAVRRGRFKLVYDRASGASRLFDLEADPQERHDVSARHPEIADALRAALRDRLAAERLGAQVELDAEEAERLRELGYLGVE